MSAAFLTEISEKDFKMACPSQQLKFRKAPNSTIIRSAAAQLCIKVGISWALWRPDVPHGVFVTKQEFPLCKTLLPAAIQEST